MKETYKYSYKKGQRLHLDDIYIIQGLGDGNWWEPDHNDDDLLIITRDIKITILIEEK